MASETFVGDVYHADFAKGALRIAHLDIVAREKTNFHH